MTELHVRSVFAQVAEAAAAVHKHTASIRRLNKQSRNELRARISDAIGNPLVVVQSRLKFLHEMADELASNDELDARTDLEGLGVLHDQISEIAIALPILMNPESVSCTSFCERFEKLADEVRAIMTAAGYDEFQASEEPPFVFSSTQRLVWTRHIIDWLQLIWTISNSVAVVLRATQARNRMPPLKLVRRQLSDYVASACETYDDEAQEGGFDFQKAAFEFRELISEQGDARAAFLIFLGTVMSELEIHARNLREVRHSTVQAALEHFEEFKRPPIPGTAEQLGIILELMPFFLSEKLPDDIELVREVLNDCYLELQRTEDEK